MAQGAAAAPRAMYWFRKLRCFQDRSDCGAKYLDPGVQRRRDFNTVPAPVGVREHASSGHVDIEHLCQAEGLGCGLHVGGPPGWYGPILCSIGSTELADISTASQIP